jgi:hypothetical protein
LKQRRWTVFADCLTIFAYDATDVSRCTELFNNVQANEHSVGLYSSWCVNGLVFAPRKCVAFSRHDNVAALVVECILARLCVDKLRRSILCLFDLWYNIG